MYSNNQRSHVDHSPGHEGTLGPSHSVKRQIKHTEVTTMKHLNALFRVLLVLAFTCTAAFAVPAEVDAAEPPSPPIVDLLSLPFAEMSGTDVSTLNVDEWSDVSEVLDSYVTSQNDETVEYALRAIIHFSEQYGQAAEFEDFSWDLYQIFRHSPNKAHRLMAIQALSKVGTETVMRHVADNIGSIESAHLQRVAKAAVNSYF